MRFQAEFPQSDRTRMAERQSLLRQLVTLRGRLHASATAAADLGVSEARRLQPGNATWRTAATNCLRLLPGCGDEAPTPTPLSPSAVQAAVVASSSQRDGTQVNANGTSGEESPERAALAAANPYKQLIDPTAPIRPGAYSVVDFFGDTFSTLYTRVDPRELLQLQVRGCPILSAPPSSSAVADNGSVDTSIRGAGASSSSATAAAAAAAAPPGPTVEERRVSALPPVLREALLRQAPIMPRGSHLQLTRGAASNVLANYRGLDISNHWGPVDNTAEIPQVRRWRR